MAAAVGLLEAGLPYPRLCHSTNGPQTRQERAESLVSHLEAGRWQRSSSEGVLCRLYGQPMLGEPLNAPGLQGRQVP